MVTDYIHYKTDAKMEILKGKANLSTEVLLKSQHLLPPPGRPISPALIYSRPFWNTSHLQTDSGNSDL